MENEITSTGWSVVTVNEVLQDAVCFEFLLELKRRMKNIESKSYISMFLKLIAPVTVYELSDSLERMGIKSKSEFFNPGMKHRVQREREKSMKTKITKSSLADLTITKMGLSFEENVYDINIVVKDNELLDMNFEIYCEDLKEDFNFWDSLFSIPRTVANAAFKGILLEKTLDDMLDAEDAKLNDIAAELDEKLNGKRYSYSVHKLFERGSNLTEIDKIFILYRYRMIKAVDFLNINVLDLKMQIGDQVLIDFSMHGYLRKYKAVAIDILGNEIINMETAFSRDILYTLGNIIQDKDFFRINRKLRNNLHYITTDSLSTVHTKIIDENQDLYLMTIKKTIEINLNIDIDQECKTMTSFLEDCINKGISKEDLDKCYPYYYLKYCENEI